MKNNMAIKIKRKLSIILSVLIDIASVGLSIMITFYLQHNSFLFFHPSQNLKWFIYFGVSVCIVIMCNIIFDCYSGIRRVAGVVDAVKLMYSGIFSFAILVILYSIPPLASFEVRISFIMLSVFIAFGFIFVSRFAFRLIEDSKIYVDNIINSKEKEKVVLVGNYDSCKITAERITANISLNKMVTKMFITHDIDADTKIFGVPIQRFSVEILCDYIRDNEMNELIICTEALSKSEIMSIFTVCKSYDCAMLKDSHYEKYSKDLFKPDFSSFNIEDILSRNVAVLETDRIEKFIKDKIVLVTGGAGSIGSEICRQVLSFGCAKLILLDINENGLFYINEELKQLYPETKFSIVLGSVRDYIRMEKTFVKYRPDVVLHAAAHKHVPLMETNAGEAIKNNVFGTKNVAELANKYKCQKFLLISSDKAVNPTNVMGATKRIAELVILDENRKKGQTDFVAVRFGNVLGSNGSVVHTFKSAIESGGPVSVTHPNIERYFMTIKEAVSLVLTTGSIAKGGEIFVLDMGTPVKIKALAEDMIRLAGLRPGIDIHIEYSGLRPGEKMFEELNLEDEKTDKTDLDKIRVLNIKSHCEDLDKKLADLNALILSPNKADYRHAIKSIVDEYVMPKEKI